MKRKKGALQISFGWLFAIIIGGFIIFLAIFGVTKLMKTEQTTIDTKAGRELGVLLNPLETSFESAKTTSFIMPAESRIYNDCSDSGNFGKQLIKISQKSFNKWTETNIDVGFANKYIFSKEIVEGKKFYVFSKPFDFPFKVSDLIYMTSSEDVYCFRDDGSIPEEIEEEIRALNQGNLLLEDCSDNMISICFSGSCDIEVYYDSGSGHVEKQDEGDMYFVTDALMYAAIFSDANVYERQLKRLMQRIEELSLIYRDKTMLISGRGCEFDIIADLMGLNNLANDFDDSENVISLGGYVEELEDKNDAGGVCALW